MKELVIDAKVENLDAVRNFITRELESANFPVKQRTQIEIAVEEIFVNIAHYAYNPGAGSTVVRVAVGDEAIIEFADGGIPYNPLQKSDPDLTVAAEERAIGGLGIYMVKNMMDAVEYRRENDKNILVIRKSVN